MLYPRYYSTEDIEGGGAEESRSVEERRAKGRKVEERGVEGIRGE